MGNNKKDIDRIKQGLEKASNSVTDVDKDLEGQEKNAEETFMSNIKGYVNHKNYENLEPYIEIITGEDTKINCLVIKGQQGLGKSTTIKSLMKKKDLGIHYINSFTTPLAFYKEVYNNRHKHLILDDTVGLYRSEKGISILRALTNTEKERYIRYESTSDKLDVPSSFIFSKSITILTNKITDKMDKSLLDRAIYRKLNFTLKEKINFMKDIIAFNYKDLEKEEITKIVNYIQKKVDETTQNFTFRSVLRVVEFYIHQNDKWKKLTDEELIKDEELVFVKEIMDMPTEQRNKLWRDETGKSVRTLQRKIREIKEKS